MGILVSNFFTVSLRYAHFVVSEQIDTSDDSIYDSFSDSSDHSTNDLRGDDSLFLSSAFSQMSDILDDNWLTEFNKKCSVYDEPTQTKPLVSEQFLLKLFPSYDLYEASNYFYIVGLGSVDLVLPPCHEENPSVEFSNQKPIKTFSVYLQSMYQEPSTFKPNIIQIIASRMYVNLRILIGENLAKEYLDQILNLAMIISSSKTNRNSALLEIPSANQNFKAAIDHFRVNFNNLLILLMKVVIEEFSKENEDRFQVIMHDLNLINFFSQVTNSRILYDNVTEPSYNDFDISLFLNRSNKFIRLLRSLELSDIKPVSFETILDNGESIQNPLIPNQNPPIPNLAVNRKIQMNEYSNIFAFALYGSLYPSQRSLFPDRLIAT